jgi:hypothetical protein
VACLDLSEALLRAEIAASKTKQSQGIYMRSGVLYVETIYVRTGHELEVVNP